MDKHDEAAIKAIGLGPDNAGPDHPVRKDYGGPALPETYWPTPQSDTPDYRNGMTLRDYFAAKAMQAILMSGQFATRDDVISGAWEYADRMLIERAKK